MKLKEFGNRLRDKRIEKSITQEELALSAKVAVSQVGRIERGEINPGLSMVITLSEALGLKPNELFSLEDDIILNRKDVGSIIDSLATIFSPNQIVTPEDTSIYSSEIVELIHQISVEMEQKSVSREMFEEVMFLSNMGYWELNLDEETIFLCRNLRAMLKVDQEVLTFDEASRLINPDDFEKIVDGITKMKHFDLNSEFSYRVIYPDQSLSGVMISKGTIDKLNQRKVIGITRVKNDNGVHFADQHQNKELEAKKKIIRDALVKINNSSFIPIENIKNMLPEIEKVLNLEDQKVLTQMVDNLLDHCVSAQEAIVQMTNDLDKV